MTCSPSILSSIGDNTQWLDLVHAFGVCFDALTVIFSLSHVSYRAKYKLCFAKERKQRLSFPYEFAMIENVTR